VAATILEPGQIEPPAGDIPFLRLAESDVFRQRAERLRQLSNQHSFGPYLGFLAALAQAQHEVLNDFPDVPLPAPEQLSVCQEHGMPVLGAQAWQRDAAWRDGLKAILHKMTSAPLPAPAAAAIDRLLKMSDTELEDIASRLMTGVLATVGAQDMPFVAAALQVYWTHMARALGEQSIGRLEQGGLCPVCGSHPVAGIVRIGGAHQGLRYLSCSLCATEWHMVRIKCSSCESTRGIHYYELEGSNGAIKAESCDECNSYLKLFYMEKDHRVEPVADDLASLALDVLMDETGKARGGPNLFFHPGSV
jgi:FdhE protein